MPSKYNLPASPETVHWGYLDARVAPVLRIQSGDRVTIQTISGTPEIVKAAPLGFEILPEYQSIFARHRRELGPHILTGPIYIEGASRGDTLEIDILDIELRQNSASRRLFRLHFCKLAVLGHLVAHVGGGVLGTVLSGRPHPIWRE